jgi:hypothetical protein
MTKAVSVRRFVFGIALGAIAGIVILYAAKGGSASAMRAPTGPVQLRKTALGPMLVEPRAGSGVRQSLLRLGRRGQVLYAGAPALHVRRRQARRPNIRRGPDQLRRRLVRPRSERPRDRAKRQFRQPRRLERRLQLRRRLLGNGQRREDDTLQLPS